MTVRHIAYGIPHSTLVRRAMSKQVKSAPVAPVATPVKALPAGLPSRGGRGGKAEFDGTAQLDGINVPVFTAGFTPGCIDYVHGVLLANPDTFVSREQIAALSLASGLFPAQTPQGARHTASCQTGPQGYSDRGVKCAVGVASDGNKGYKIDKAGSERALVDAIKAGFGWGEQPKNVRLVARQGFPWGQLVTTEAKTAGFTGRDIIVPPAPPAPAKPAKPKKK